MIAVAYQQAIESAIAASATPSMMTGTGLGVAAYTTGNDMMGVAGIGLTLIGLCVNLTNLYYRRLENARQLIEHEARMAQLDAHD